MRHLAILTGILLVAVICPALFAQESLTNRSGDDGWLRPADRTNGQAEPRSWPAWAPRLDFAVGAASFALEGSVSNVNADAVSGTLSRVFLRWERPLGASLGLSLEFGRADVAGFTVGARAVYRRAAVATDRLVDDDGFAASAGLVLVKAPAYRSSPFLLFAASARLGNEFGSFLALDTQGFGVAPVSPGFLVADNNTLACAAQWRFGWWRWLGLWGEVAETTREVSPAAVPLQDVHIHLRWSFAFFFGDEGRLSVGWHLEQLARRRFTTDASGTSQPSLDRYLTVESLALRWDGRLRTAGGGLYRYAWGAEFILGVHGENSFSGGTGNGSGPGYRFYYEGSVPL